MAAAQRDNPHTIAPERAPDLTMPARFFAAGLLFLVALLVVAIRQSQMLVLDYLHNPATLAVTHLFTLGFAGLIGAGAIYQITPVLLYSRPANSHLATLHLLLQSAGAVTLVAGFLRYEPRWMAVGGALVLAGGILFGANLIPVWLAVQRWNWHGRLIAAAVICYLLTLLWGLVMAFNLQYGFLPDVEGGPLASHLALGLVGWFTLLIIAVGLKLVPMFAPARPLPGSIVATIGGALLLGVVLFIGGTLAGRTLLWLGALLMAGAALAYTGALCHSCFHRRGRALDVSTRFPLTAAAALSLIALAALAGLAGLWSIRPLAAGLTLLFAFAWIGGTILGMLLRILPFLVWLHRFRLRIDQQERIPSLQEMYHPNLGWIAYGGWFAGSLILSAGLAVQSVGLTRFGAAACLGALVPFGLAMAQILRHMRPGRPH